MPSLSSAEMRKAWRYQPHRDFQPLSNSPPTTHEQAHTLLPTTYKPLGSESSFLPFQSSTPITESPYHLKPDLDYTGSKLVIGQGPDIYVYDLAGIDSPPGTTTLPPPRILRGHVEIVTLVRFVKGSSTLLVSAADSPGSRRLMVGEVERDTGPEIILWDLADPSRTDGRAEGGISDDLLNKAVDGAVSAALEVLSSPADTSTGSLTPYTLDMSDETGLRKSIRTALRRADTKALVPSSRKIAGRFAASFQSEPFSHVGGRFTYLPGESPQSNGDAEHSICVRDIATSRVVTLIGHRDAIMWTGFSPDDTLIASVAWDQSVRIWDANTGEQKWCFKTEGQNWAGAWSPDGKKFLGTCGRGTIHLWDVETGEEVWRTTQKHASGEWYRHVSWSSPIPGVNVKVKSQTGLVDESLDEGLIAVGGSSYGRVILLTPHPSKGDTKDKQILQERTVSVENIALAPEVKGMAGRYLGVSYVRFLASPDRENEGWGVRLAYSMDIEEGVEVVDLVKGKKWRLGVSAEGDAKGEQDKKEGTWGYGPSYWLYSETSGQMLNVDQDGIRSFDLD